MKSIKTILFKILSLQSYLRLLHKSFHFLYSINFLKNDPIYKYHYFDKKIIRNGDYIIDLGANLGYYTILFAKWTGKTGKVYAVEPVSYFADTIKWASKKYENIELYPYALGNEEKEVTMGTPDKFGYLRTGLLHVIDQDDNDSAHEFAFKAQMKKGSVLFKNISRLDFIKCDIEGYEEFVLPEMAEVLMKFKPIIQLETWGKHKANVEKFLVEMGYEIYSLEDNVIKSLDEIQNNEPGDLIFINKNNKSALERIKNI